MAGKDKNTYEKVHKQLSDAMQDAYINDVFKDIKEPNIDLSFLADDNKKKRKHSKLLRVVSIAAVTIIVLLGANIALLSSDSMDAYGDKGILHRLYEGINGIFTDEDDSESTDVMETFETTDEKDISNAKEFFGALLVPEYIPEGYKLNFLTIEKYNSGDVVSTYNYLDSSGSSLDIIILHNDDLEFNYESQTEGEFIELEDRVMHLTWNDIFEEYALTVYVETASVDICMAGSKDKELLIEIGKNLNK